MTQTLIVPQPVVDNMVVPELICLGLCWTEAASLSLQRWNQTPLISIEVRRDTQEIVKHTLRIQPALIIVEIENAHDGRIALLQQLLKDRGNPRPPLMACSHCHSEEVIVEAFRAGAERFIHTAASHREFYALAHAQLRRHSGGSLDSDSSVFGPFTLNGSNSTLHHSNAYFRLTELEFRFFNALLQAEGKPVSTRVLLNRVWGLSLAEPNTNRVQTLASRVRSKTGLNGKTEWTVRYKAGYYSLTTSKKTTTTRL